MKLLHPPFHPHSLPPSPPPHGICIYDSFLFLFFSQEKKINKIKKKTLTQAWYALIELRNMMKKFVTILFNKEGHVNSASPAYTKTKIKNLGFFFYMGHILVVYKVVYAVVYMVAYTEKEELKISVFNKEMYMIEFLKIDVAAFLSLSILPLHTHIHTYTMHIYIPSSIVALLA